jgi:hypothetical protein
MVALPYSKCNALPRAWNESAEKKSIPGDLITFEVLNDNFNFIVAGPWN